MPTDIGSLNIHHAPPALITGAAENALGQPVSDWYPTEFNHPLPTAAVLLMVLRWSQHFSLDGTRLTAQGSFAPNVADPLIGHCCINNRVGD